MKEKLYDLLTEARDNTDLYKVYRTYSTQDYCKFITDYVYWSTVIGWLEDELDCD